MGFTKKQLETETFVIAKDHVMNKIMLVACPSDFQVGTTEVNSDLTLTGKLTVSTKMYTDGDNIDSSTVVALIGGTSIPKTRTITAPKGTRNGQLLYVKDATGIASTDPIALVFQGGDTQPDGSGGIIISSDYESYTLCWHEGKWYAL